MKILNLVNWPIILSSLSLLSFGILVIYSSSPELAIQQSIFAFVGIAVFLFISQIELYSIRNLINPLYILIIILLVVVFILGIETRGSLRWIPLGIFNIQPSEFAKPVLILTLAKFWSGRLPNWQNILKSILWSLPFLILVFRQPDLGSTLTIGAIWLGMLFASEISFKKTVLIGLISLFIIPLSWMFLHDYQRDRITSFLDPGGDPLGRGYNVIQSTIAVGSGELIGRGLGRGTQSRLQFLPEFRTDFIFASIAEEMGFIGSLIIISIYLYLLIYSLKVIQKGVSHFNFLIIIGVVSMLLFQIFVNIGMNMGLLPITGITLPLLSYGGSSLIATLICLALVASIVRFKDRFRSHDEEFS